jgi:N-acetyltransferase
MTVADLQPIDLENEKVKLVPLSENDFERLYEVASDPLIWEQHPNRNRYQKEVFETYFKGAMESGGAFLILNAATCEPIGCSRFYDLDEHAKTVTIGYTFYGRNCWGKGFNPSAKSLMLAHAFNFSDSVIFHVGAKNIRSQKAMEAIGAQKIREEEVAYYGEASNLNFVYEIKKSAWKNKIV